MSFMKTSKKTTGFRQLRNALLCMSTRLSLKNLGLGVTTLLDQSHIAPVLADMYGAPSSNF
ncbi:hypothetical protein KIN20_005003 [Parelaphostrongylus tenuis]|uniref:Uncharacterized protein n=1 Tax=Parelaphostrongylus tenuis TaxID=148309 RepID=A0AAD5M1F5_PARTN|nr:hypothetical protein KIN20_005003 [Parelaphostrongylus tenuis]